MPGSSECRSEVGSWDVCMCMAVVITIFFDVGDIRVCASFPGEGYHGETEALMLTTTTTSVDVGWDGLQRCGLGGLR